MLIHDGKRALVVFSDLKDIGVKLALDDFGTGYSSLVCLETHAIGTLSRQSTNGNASVSQA